MGDTNVELIQAITRVMELATVVMDTTDEDEIVYRRLRDAYVPRRLIQETRWNRAGISMEDWEGFLQAEAEAESILRVVAVLFDDTVWHRIYTEGTQAVAKNSETVYGAIHFDDDDDDRRSGIREAHLSVESEESPTEPSRPGTLPAGAEECGSPSGPSRRARTAAGWEG